MTNDVHHPVVARMWDRMSRKAEGRGQGEHRGELLRGLAGRVIEVGAGNGINFAHYPSSVERVIAVEPERHLRERAEEGAERAPVPVEVRDGAGVSCPSTRARSMPASPASYSARFPTRSGRSPSSTA